MTNSFDSGYGLSIGVGSFAKLTDWNVPQASADAIAVADVLRDPALCGYPEDRVTLLTETSATRQAILDALDTLASRVDASSTAFLFFSGHGAYDTNGVYSLTTYDTRASGQKVVPGTAVSLGALLSSLHNIKATKLVVVLNLSLVKETMDLASEQHAHLFSVSPSEDELVSLLGSGEGRVIITACRPGQRSYVGTGQLTLFTEELVNGLRGGIGVRGRGGLINIYDLYTSLFYALDEASNDNTRVSPQLLNAYGTQEPQLTTVRNTAAFPIGLYKGSPPHLGAFNTSAHPAEDTAFREGSRAEARSLFHQYAQQEKSTVQVNQSGGIHFGLGTVNQISGDIVHGDKIWGDKIGGDKITVGDITGSGIAIGRGASAYVNTDTANASKLGQAFQAIYTQIRGGQLSERRKDLVIQQVQQIESEVIRGDLADASFIRDLLASLQGIAPDICGAIAQTLASAGREVSSEVRRVAASI